MHSRRFACLLLGMWLAGGLLMAWLTHENSRAVDRLLVQADPAVTLRMKVLGPAETGMLLRYQTAEINRYNVEMWLVFQICLGAFFLFFMLFGTGEGKFSLALALALLLCVLVERFGIWPEILSLGKLTDFTAPNASSGYRTRLLVMESGYLGVEVGKWVVMAVLAGIMIGRGRSRGKKSDDSWKKFHMVNKADDRHVDR